MQHRKAEKSICTKRPKNLQRPLSVFTTKLIHVCYKFKALLQHPVVEENTNVDNDQQILQNLAYAFTTKLIQVCYKIIAFMQHPKAEENTNVAND